MSEHTNGSSLFRGPMITIGREEIILDNANTRSSAESSKSSSSSSSKKSHGFHLVRSKWDPYPWIGSVESDSSAKVAGLRSGDCLLEIDGQDVLGLEMSDIAELIGKQDRAKLSIWRRPPKSQSHESNVDFAYLGGAAGDDDKENVDGEHSVSQTTLLEGPLPEVAQKLVRAVSGVVKALECPVCLESAAPPVSQCVHGHLLCFGCRLKTARCPVCRVRLGQGRCLLADKSHRVLSEALVDKEDRCDEEVKTRSLHDSIFGPNLKKQTKKEQRRRNKSPKKHLLSKVFASSARSGIIADDDRNASTESLPNTTTAPNSSSSMDANLLYGRRWLLRLYDRRKSASTGELNKNSSSAGSSFNQTSDRDEVASGGSGSLLSVPQTPVWGGSTESMTCSGRLTCPLKERTGCRESLNSSTMMEHLQHHHPGPFIHFYKKKISLPIPFPFEEDAVYVLHYKEEIFILQSENNKVWMSNAEANCGVSWEWALHGVADNSTEINLRKEVVSLREPFELQPYHVAKLPDDFSASTVSITLIELDADEGCIKV